MQQKKHVFSLDWSLDLSEREPNVSVMMHAHMFVFLHACFRRHVCLFACIFACVHVRVLLFAFLHIICQYMHVYLYVPIH